MPAAIRIVTTILPLLLGALTAFSGDIQSYVAAHPALMTGLGALYAALAAIMPSPLVPKGPQG